jgi:hypothetical protein
MKLAHSERKGLCCTFFAIYQVYRQGDGMLPETRGVENPVRGKKSRDLEESIVDYPYPWRLFTTTEMASRWDRPGQPITMSNQITSESVARMHVPSSADWESIPSGLGGRLIGYLLSRSDLYGNKSSLAFADADFDSLSASGPFGGAVAFTLGGEVGKRAWRSRWSGNREAVVMVLSMIARKGSSHKFGKGDIDSLIVSDPEIARSILAANAYDNYSGGNPFRVLTGDHIRSMYEQDADAIASVVIADRHVMIDRVFESLKEIDTSRLVSAIARVGSVHGVGALDFMHIISRHIDPCSPAGISAVSDVVESIGQRWNPKADRNLRTSELLDRDTQSWSKQPTGWLRLALNHCTKESPDTLVSWIGQAPCLYEFLNTAAKQRRSVIAARKLIKMVGR